MMAHHLLTIQKLVLQYMELDNLISYYEEVVINSNCNCRFIRLGHVGILSISFASQSGRNTFVAMKISEIPLWFRTIKSNGTSFCAVSQDVGNQVLECTFSNDIGITIWGTAVSASGQLIILCE